MLSMGQCYQWVNVINGLMLSTGSCYQLVYVIHPFMLSTGSCYQPVNVFKFIKNDKSQITPPCITFLEIKDNLNYPFVNLVTS
jgi:hypothetical protein